MPSDLSSELNRESGIIVDLDLLMPGVRRSEYMQTLGLLSEALHLGAGDLAQEMHFELRCLARPAHLPPPAEHPLYEEISHPAGGHDPRREEPGAV